MKELIVLIIAVALGSVYMLYGVNYTNYNKVIEKKLEIEIMTSFSSLSQGYLAYNLNERKSLPIINWKNEYEKYSFLPNDYKNLTWEYNENENGKYFCLHGNTRSNTLYEVFENISKNNNEKRFFFNTNCGATENFSVKPNFNENYTLSGTYYLR